MTEHERFEGWAILELMGHRRLAGWVTETELAGAGMIRIDVPDRSTDHVVAPPVSQFYSPAAVYALTPTTEDLVLAVAARPAPVHAYELPRPALPPAPPEPTLDVAGALAAIDDVARWLRTDAELRVQHAEAASFVETLDRAAASLRPPADDDRPEWGELFDETDDDLADQVEHAAGAVHAELEPDAIVAEHDGLAF